MLTVADKVVLPPKQNGVTGVIVALVCGKIFTTPVFVTVPQPPVRVILNGKVPVKVDEPVIVTTSVAHPPSMPVGKPEKVAPVAPAVA